MKNHNSETSDSVFIFLTLLTLALFWQTGNHEFLDIDDNIYVTNNIHIKEGITLKGIAWAFSSLYAGFWHPLTWLSHMLDVQLYGMSHKGHHLTNLLLHIINTVLLFYILELMTRTVWRSAFVAAIFAVHPLHVESVAWIAERKDLLSTLFWFLTIWAYIKYARKREAKSYLLVITMFLMSIMAKPMAVSLPFILLLIDYWPLKRLCFSKKEGRQREEPHVNVIISRLLIEKIPLVLLSAGASLVAIIAQHHMKALESLNVLTLKVRIANAFVSYISYIWKMFLPYNLSFYYPHQGMPPLLQTFFSVAIFFLLTYFVIKRGKTHAYLATGWFWYVISLLPVIGLVQVGSHALADRYTYVSLIGLFIILAWGAPDLFYCKGFRKQIILVLSIIALISYSLITWNQVKKWQNSLTLFRHSLKVTENNFLIHNNIGAVFGKMGEYDKAMAHFHEALKIKPDYINALNNIGATLLKQGKIEEMHVHYTLFLKLYPKSAEAHNGMGMVLLEKGEKGKARDYFKKALTINPGFTAAKVNLART